MSFDETAYYRQKFEGVELTAGRIHGVKFDECSFYDCRFIDSKIEKCAFIDCSFHDSVLSAINPVDSRFLRPKFDRCKVIGCDWAKAGKLEALDFEECQVDYSNFASLRLPKIRMVKCSAKEVRFIEADMTDGVFGGTDFAGSIFFKSILTGADFRRARNYSIDVRNNAIKGTQFSLPEVLALLDGLEVKIE